MEVNVIVISRFGIDLANLSRHDGPMAGPCGTVGASIARAVFEGNGKAQVSLAKINMAFDTQEGVQMIMDNFELYEAKTMTPLVFFLTAKYLKKS